MAGQAFRFKPALAKLPEGAERPIVEQFRSIQNDLDAVRGRQVSVTPILSVAQYAPRIGELVLLSPPTAGTLIALPQGSPQNVAATIRIAVVGGVLSPGVTVAIVGRKGTINGQQTLNLNSHRLVELVSCGAPGWFYSV
jgi:hypothetical protein